MADVTMSLTNESDTTTGQIIPKAGGTFQVEFDVGQANVKVDYSNENAITVTVHGEFSLRSLGLPVDLGADGSIDLDGNTQFSGSASWEIQKHVSAQVGVQYANNEASGTAALTIEF